MFFANWMLFVNVNGSYRQYDIIIYGIVVLALFVNIYVNVHIFSCQYYVIILVFCYYDLCCGFILYNNCF